jgi:hypothetical protein
MAALYVRALFGLLRHLGVQQQRVADAIGPNKIQVSLWAHGKRPLPRKLEQGFLTYVDAAMQARRTETAALLHHLHQWELECSAQVGTLTAQLERARARVRAYDHLDPIHVDDHDFATYAMALRQAYRSLRLLAQWRRRADVTAGRLLMPPGREEISPSAYLWAIYARYGGQRADEADEADKAVAAADEDDEGGAEAEPGRPD